MAPTGHIGIALGLRNLAPKLPLAAWIVLPCLTDIFYGILSAAGIESQEYSPYTHSIAGAFVLSLLAAAAAFACLRDRRAALAAFAVTLSHIAADFTVWSNLSLAPGFPSNLGLGFYDRIGFSMATAGMNAPSLMATAFELLLLAAGIAVMRRSARAARP